MKSMTLTKNTHWLLLLVLSILAGSAALFTGCKHPDSGEHSTAPAAKYTCPMHPEVLAATPGKCPKCGMDLVEKK
jgi:Heavy metal binding domain